MQTTVDGSDNRLLNIVIVLIVVFIVILILYILSKWLYLQLNIQLQWMTVLFFLHLRSYLSLYVFLVIVSCLFFISIWIKFNACISFCVVFGFLNRTAVSESQQRTRNPYQCCLELEERHLFAQEFLSERLDLFQLLIACFLLAVSFQLRRIHHLQFIYSSGSCLFESRYFEWLDLSWRERHRSTILFEYKNKWNPIQSDTQLIIGSSVAKISSWKYRWCYFSW